MEDRGVKHSALNMLKWYMDKSKTSEGTRAGLAAPANENLWEYFPESFRLKITILNSV